jgi:hypothetical protein
MKFKQKRGQSIADTSLMIGLVAVVIVGSLSFVGDAVKKTGSAITGQLQYAQQLSGTPDSSGATVGTGTTDTAGPQDKSCSPNGTSYEDDYWHYDCVSGQWVKTPL